MANPPMEHPASPSSTSPAIPIRRAANPANYSTGGGGRMGGVRGGVRGGAVASGDTGGIGAASPTSSRGGNGGGIGAVIGGIGGAIAIPGAYRRRDGTDDHHDGHQHGHHHNDDSDHNHDHHYGTCPYSPSSSSSDGESDGVNREIFLSGSYSRGDVLDAMDGTSVVVGSLPMSRYERRRMAAAANGVRSGIGIAMATGSVGGVSTGVTRDMFAHHAGRIVVDTADMNSGAGAAAADAAADAAAAAAGSNNGGGGLARSLPPPKAPWLHARAMSEESISRVPQIVLPESVMEGMVPSSLPYGSLRESKFGHYHQRGRRPPPGGGPQRRVRFAGASPNNALGMYHASRNEEDNAARIGLCPNSLPAYTDAGSELARRRWEREAAASVSASASPDGGSGGGGGIVVGPGGRAGSSSSSSPSSSLFSSSALASCGGGSGGGGGGGGGIGAAIANSPPMDGAPSMLAAVGSLAAQLGDLSTPSSAGEISEATEGAAINADHPTSNSGGGIGIGIGSGCEDYDGEIKGVGYKGGVLYDDQAGIGNEGGCDDDDDDDDVYEGEGSNSKLSSSLTALTILESTRLSPGGLGLAAPNPQERCGAVGSAVVPEAPVALGGIGMAQVDAMGNFAPQQTELEAAHPYAATPLMEEVVVGGFQSEFSPNVGDGATVEEPDHFEAFEFEE